MDEVQKACKVLTDELNKKESFYDAFVSSVESTFDECGVAYLPFVVENDRELAEKVVDRLIGK